VLLPSGVLINGQKLNFLNNLDIASDGLIYLSDSSVYQRHDFLMDLLDGRPTGRSGDTYEL
jgi:sugar lactone lactonase YvrE